MDDRLKQRLVGALVIVALAVIFVPMFLEGPNDMGEAGSNMPSPPDYTSGSDSEPLKLPPPSLPTPPETVMPELEQESMTAAGSETPTAADAVTPPPAAPEEPAQEAPPVSEPETALPAESPETAPPAADSALKGWVVQLASLGNQANAFALRDKLRKQGYTAFVEKAQTDKGILYRVRVGPELQRETAEKLRDKLAGETDLKGMVTSYP